MTPVESNNQEIGFEESLERIGALLEPEKAKPTPKRQPLDEEEPEAAELDDAEPEEAADEGEPDDAEDAEPAEDDDSEQPEEATQDEEIEFDGHKFRIPPELKPALLRQQDYTRKTQELAEQRKHVQATHEKAQQLHTQYAQGMQILGQALQAIAPPQPDPALLDSDPVEYIRQERAWMAHGQKLNAVQQEQQRNLQLWQQQQAEESQKRRAEMVSQLPQLIPEWKDNKRAHKEFGEVCEYLKGRGFSVDELNFADDPRAFAIAREAWIGRQMIERQKSAKPVPTKTAAPGAARTGPSEATHVQKARQALKRSGGRDKHAAEVLIARFLK